MNASPEAGKVRDALARFWRSRVSLALIDGAAAGCALAAVVTVMLWLAGSSRVVPAAVAALALTMVAAVMIVMTRRSRMPYEIERRAPDCRNLVITAAEILETPARTTPGVVDLVCRHAVARLNALDAGTVFQLPRAMLRSVSIAIVTMAIAAAATTWPRRIGESSTVLAAGAPIRRVVVTVSSPAYAGIADRVLQDPVEVRALAGSRLHIAVEGPPPVTLETIDSRQDLPIGADGRAAGDVTLARDGFLAIQAGGTAPASRRLIGVIADPDRSPAVRVTEPARDLFEPSGDRRIAISLQAEDDLALASLELAYTRVSGSGENFQFGEGTVPVTIARDDDRRWRATADWNLATLQLAPGDMVVYRGVAADRRPGAPRVESDAFIVQILTPNQASAGGFSLDEDPNKYALSQRMVIVKTEKLLARKSSMTPADFADEAMGLAAEQRSVRALFIFMLGGEFEDAALTSELNEVAETESEADLAAGRQRNQARIDLIQATRHMSAAAASLAEPAVPSALTSEKAALDAIQRAFNKDRYLLRALATNQRIDPARRLSGTLKDIARGPRPAAAPEEPAPAAAMRRLLAGVAGLADATLPAADRASRLSALAETAVRIDPASAELRAIAGTLTRAAAEAGRPAAARGLVDEASVAIAAAIRASSAEAPASAGLSRRRAEGAVADALRAGGSR